MTREKFFDGKFCLEIFCRAKIFNLRCTKFAQKVSRKYWLLIIVLVAYYWYVVMSHIQIWDEANVRALELSKAPGKFFSLFYASAGQHLP